MKTISATDAKQRFAMVLDAAQKEPVLIRRQNRDVAVVLSPEQFHRMRGYLKEELLQLCERVGQRAVAAGLTEEKLAELLNSPDE